jgi:archaellum component FlaC
VKARLRRLLDRGRRMALGPVLHRIDVLAEENDRRLDEINKRLDDFEALLQMVEGRVATVAERTITAQESQARLARRVDEIEKLLADE